MRHAEFSIGLEFFCDGRRWRCTDVGMRVIAAICVEPREMVRQARDPQDGTRYIETRFVSDDQGDLGGPPYGVKEEVFDELDIGACSAENQDAGHLVNLSRPLGSRPLTANT